MEGFLAVFEPMTLLIILVGVAVGIVFGAIPGMSATMAVALCLPISFGLDTVSGLSLLIGLYIGGISGGLISAVLLKIPGTPSSIATTFDGSPMAAKGEAGKALGVGIVYSFIGTMFSIAALMFIAPPIAKFSLKFSPFEYFSVSVFALTMITALAQGNLLKGILSGLFGVSMSFVGSSPIDSYDRFTFGFTSLQAGFSLLAVMIGLYAITEIFQTAADSTRNEKAEVANFKIKGFGFTWSEFTGQTWNMIRSAIIGIGIGILPGIGGGTSNLLAYTVAKNSSKNPEKFGTGIIDGVVASETANNASIGGAIIPLLTLGIPGDTVTAMLLGGMMIHGIVPGPMLFQTNGSLVYAIFAALIVATTMMLILEFFGIRFFVKLLQIPKHILLSVIVMLCVVGAYASNNSMIDVYSMAAFGFIGYTLSRFHYPLPPIILGFILSPTIEISMRRGLMMSNNSFEPFFTKPISAVFLALAVLSIVLAGIKQYKQMKQDKV